jgi:hypothetical protein
MFRKLVLSTLITLLAATTALAGPTKWLHVAVDEGGKDGERVRINLPLDLVEAVIPHIEVDEFHRGKVRIDHGDFDEVDLHAILSAVRDAEDGEYVTVEEGDETVRVAKEGEQFIINVEEDGGSKEKVTVKIRMELVDALISGEEGELDVLAVIRMLGEHEDGLLVQVMEDDETVRIWVDSKSTIE